MPSSKRKLPGAGAESAADYNWRVVVNAMRDPVFVHDMQGRILGANRSYAALAGMGLTEIVGRLYWEVFPRRTGPLPGHAGGRRMLPHDEINDELHLETGQTFRSRSFGLFDGSGSLSALAHVLEDVTQAYRAERRLKQLNRMYRMTIRCNRQVSSALDEETLAHKVCEIVIEQGGYHMAWVGHALHDERRSLVPVASAGIDLGYVDALNLSWADDATGPGACCIRESTPQVVRNIPHDPQFAHWRAEALRRGYASAIALPLNRRGGTFGLLGIYSTRIDAFDQQEIDLLMGVADSLAFGIGAQRTRGELERLQTDYLRDLEDRDGLFDTAMQAMTVITEMRDPATAVHQDRVAGLAVALATAAGLPDDRIAGLRMAAKLHDIGHIRVPMEILASPRRLTDDEFGIVKTHPAVAGEILKDFTFKLPVAQIIAQHHERLDGSGYPLGLRGDEILLEARILAVADVVEAMVSPRPYRPAFSIDTALEEIAAGRGTRYDPGVVAACLRLFRETGYKLV